MRISKAHLHAYAHRWLRADWVLLLNALHFTIVATMHVSSSWYGTVSSSEYGAATFLLFNVAVPESGRPLELYLIELAISQNIRILKNQNHFFVRHICPTVEVYEVCFELFFRELPRTRRIILCQLLRKLCPVLSESSPTHQCLLQLICVDRPISCFVCSPQHKLNLFIRWRLPCGREVINVGH